MLAGGEGRAHQRGGWALSPEPGGEGARWRRKEAVALARMEADGRARRRGGGALAGGEDGRACRSPEGRGTVETKARGWRWTATLGHMERGAGGGGC